MSGFHFLMAVLFAMGAAITSFWSLSAAIFGSLMCLVWALDGVAHALRPASSKEERAA